MDSDAPVELSPFTVSASANVGYGGNQSGSSGRLNQSYADTPQSISIVTRELLDDAMIFNSRDAVQFVPNVQPDATHEPNFRLRGITTYSMFIDGFYSAKSFNFDNFFADRVEVVVGPTASTFGRGDPAGFINFISKRPQFRERTDLGVIISDGLKDGLRATLDQNGLLGSDGNTAYRLTTVYHSGSGTKDLSTFKRFGALFGATHRLGDRGTVTLLAQAQRNRVPSAVGNVSFVDPHLRDEWMSRAGNTTTGVPALDHDRVLGYDDDAFDQDLTLATAILEYKLADDWWFRGAARYSSSEQIGEFGAGNAGSISRDASGVLTVAIPKLKDQTVGRGWAMQGDVVWRTDRTGLGNFEFLAGVDASKDKRVYVRQVAGTPRQPLLNFNPTPPGVAFPPINKTGVLNDGLAWGVYAQGTAGLLDNRVIATGSLRKQYYDLDAISRANGSVTNRSDNTDMVPRFSLILKPRRSMSIYALFSRHEDPGSVIAAFGNIPPSDPRSSLLLNIQPRTELREAGLKAELMDGRLQVSLARFETKSTGDQRIQVVQESIGGIGVPVEYRYLSDEEASGWELTASGVIKERLVFVLGVGLIDGDTIVNLLTGQRIPLLQMQDNVSLYAKYHLGPQPNEGAGLIFGGKVIFSGWNMSQTRENNYPETQSIFDLGAYYKFGRYTVSLKVNNAFDQDYSATQTLVLDKRQVFLSMGATF